MVSRRDRRDTHTRPTESHVPFISGSGVQTQTAHTPVFFTLAGRDGHTNPDLGQPSANKPPPSRREGSEGDAMERRVVGGARSVSARGGVAALSLAFRRSKQCVGNSFHI